MGIETRSLSRHGTPFAESIGRAIRFRHASRIIPTVRRPRTASAPAAQSIGSHGRRAGAGFGNAGIGFRTAMATTAMEGDAANVEIGARAPIGGTSSDSTGSVSKHTAVAIHPQRRAEADARRIANVA